MKPLRCAIISFAHMHAYSYADVLLRCPQADLVAIADNDPQRLHELQQRYPQVKHWFEDYRDLLSGLPCDAVIITSPNAEHAAIALDCVAAGKHILCEKPIATNLADARRMIEAAHEADRLFMTAFPVRFSPAIQYAKHVITSDAFGRLLGGSTSNHGSMPGGWFVQPELSGGGAVIDHTVHVVDLLRWLFECEVEEVFAHYANRLHPEIPCEDVGLLSLRMANGAVLTLDTSWSRCKSYPIWGDVKLDLRGTRGRMSIDCFPQQVNLFDDQRNRHESFSCGDNLDELMIREFLTAIHEHRPPAVTGEDGLRALEVALAAYESARRNCPVRIADSRPKLRA